MYWIIFCFSCLRMSLWIYLTFWWHPLSSLTKASCKRLSYLFSWQRNHIICPSIGDHCYQTSSCPITLLNSIHPPSFHPLHSDPTLHLLIPHPILSGFILCRLYICHSIYYPFPAPLCPAPWFIARQKAWFELIYSRFYVHLQSAFNGEKDHYMVSLWCPVSKQPWMLSNASQMLKWRMRSFSIYKLPNKTLCRIKDIKGRY